MARERLGGIAPSGRGQRTMRLADRLARWARIARQVMGVPDYERYVAHERACHPDREPLAREAFMRERLAARYERPGARCC